MFKTTTTWVGQAAICMVVGSLLLHSPPANGQGLGGSATIKGTVADPSGGALVGAAVEVRNRLSGYRRTTATDQTGSFQFPNVPFNSYRFAITVIGFQTFEQDVMARTSVPIVLTVTMSLAAASSSISVEGSGQAIIETTATAHAAVDSSLIQQLPIQNQATGFSELVTLSTPGVAADGNGFAHPLGEHADTSISLDNQPITDQQAKIFSNQLAPNIVQSMEVITGAPPAEYGDKTSLIVNVVTQSGLGKVTPMGSLSAQYGSFGTWAESFTLAVGDARWGNFLAVNSTTTGRFLDTPEFSPLHGHGNSENVFDRIDFQPNDKDSFHLNLSVARSWFQTPNSYDAQTAAQDQRSQIRSINIAPGWTHLFNSTNLLTFNPFFRLDRSQYFPSANPLSDTTATVAQNRYLNNIGFRSDLSYAHGVHNAKVGVQYWHTLLREGFSLGLTDPAYNPVCRDANGSAVTDPGLLDPQQCAAAGYRANRDLAPNLLTHDLTRGGQPYHFQGSTDIREAAIYAQDSITLGRLNLNPGLRYDDYKGLTLGHQLEPRFGAAYRLPWTGTVLRLSYARLFETPYNENLILSSGLSGNPFGTFRSAPILTGKRNQYNAGLAQAFGRRVTMDADYFWKFTHNAFDFDSLFDSPITFPVGWRKSKIDGLAARVSMVDFRGFSAYSVIGHVRSRFYEPEIGGLIFNSQPGNGVFRIDHAEEFQQTTHVRYELGREKPWISFTWRFNSGLALPGRVPDYSSALLLTADQQAQMGLYCGDRFAIQGDPIRSCALPRFGATRVVIPAPGAENDDTNPTRVSPRHLFDLGTGMDNLLRGDRYKVRVHVSVLNLANRVALFNFLSTFSGTHFVTPRAYQVEMGMVF